MPKSPRQLLYRALGGTLLASVLLPGCSSSPHEGTPVFDAWGADGSGGEFEDPGQAIAANQEYGVIYRFEPGDVIDLQMAINGDIIRSDEPINATMRVQKPLWIHLSPDGPAVSYDGETWSSPNNAATGSLSLEFSISQEDPRNLCFLRLRAEEK